MTPPPYWALSLVYWLHMLATVAWIGSLVALSILVLPAARQALEPIAFADLVARLRRRLNPLGWLSLLVLTATGMFQMSANPNYQGFLTLGNRWAVAILIKHLLFLCMVGVSAYLSWVLIPRLQRAALLQARDLSAPQAQSWRRQEAFLLRLNLLLALLVLAFTALARAS